MVSSSHSKPYAFRKTGFMLLYWNFYGTVDMPYENMGPYKGHGMFVFLIYLLFFEKIWWSKPPPLKVTSAIAC